MKFFTRFTRLGLVATGCLLMVIAFTGCDKGMFPTAPEEDLEAPQSIAYEDFKPLKYNGVKLILAAPVTVTEHIIAAEGGKLKIKFKAGDDLYVTAKLRIKPNTIPNDMTLSMSMDPDKLKANLDVVFGPHGLEFSKDARLDIYAEGLDLSGVNTRKIWLYYDNPDTGCWERMRCKEVEVDKDDGEIEVEGGRLPHFSRYALSKG